jgi:hypothetical protein
LIRRLTDIKHIPQIIAYGKAWHEKSAMKDLPYSPERCRETIKSCMLMPGHIVLGAYDKGQMCGVLIGAICHYQFFDAEYATDLVFVADKYGLQLFQEFCKWTAKLGIKVMQVGVTSGLPQAEQFYEKLGMQRIGSIFLDKV